MRNGAVKWSHFYFCLKVPNKLFRACEVPGTYWENLINIWRSHVLWFLWHCLFLMFIFHYTTFIYIYTTHHNYDYPRGALKFFAYNPGVFWTILHFLAFKWESKPSRLMKITELNRRRPSDHPNILHAVVYGPVMKDHQTILIFYMQWYMDLLWKTIRPY